jgi:DNA polymerase III epsilon subunit-like protein
MGQLVFVDLETTGLDLDRNGIIEIGAVFETDGQREPDDFQALANPGNVEYNAEAAKIHNISRETINAASPLAEVLKQFDDRCADNAVISGWNTKFDEAFLYKAYRRHGIPWRFDYHIFDVWSIYKRLQLIGKLPTDMHLGLGTVAQYYNIVRDGEDHHRALNDVEWTWRLHRLSLGKESCPR